MPHARSKTSTPDGVRSCYPGAVKLTAHHERTFAAAPNVYHCSSKLAALGSVIKKKTNFYTVQTRKTDQSPRKSILRQQKYFRSPSCAVSVCVRVPVPLNGVNSMSKPDCSKKTAMSPSEVSVVLLFCLLVTHTRRAKLLSRSAGSTGLFVVKRPSTTNCMVAVFPQHTCVARICTNKRKKKKHTLGNPCKEA